MAAAGCADSALLVVSSLSRGHMAPQVGCTWMHLLSVALWIDHLQHLGR